MAAIWPQVPITLAVALVVSGVSLLGRYRHRGQPFGTPAARKRAAAVIVATAVAATAVAYLVTSLSPESIGMSVGFLIPPLMCVHRLREEAAPDGMIAHPPIWLEVATVGVAHLLDKLQLQMAIDRDNWCDRQLAKLRLDPRRSPRQSLTRLGTAGRDLYARLDGRRHHGQPPSERLETAYESLQSALHCGEAAGLTIGELRKQAIKARKAFTDMLQFAYDRGHTDDGILPTAAGQGPPSPAARMAAGPPSRSRR